MPHVKKLLALAGAGLIAGAALAADLPSRDAPPPPSPYLAPTPVFSWTGFYVGANLGAGFNGGASNYRGYGFYTRSTAAADYIRNNSGNKSVFTGGLFAGYNYQVQSFVASAEVDLNYLGDIRKNTSVTYVTNGSGNAPAGTYGFTTGRNANYFGTVRGRLGYAIDRFLPYVTGGLAYAGNSGSGSGTLTYTSNTGAVTTINRTGSGNSHIGYAIGGGIEYAFSDRITARAEYLYINLGNKTRTFVAPNGSSYSLVNNTREHFSVARAGVSYRF